MGDSGAAQAKLEAAQARWQAIPANRAKSSAFSSVTPVPLEKPNPWHSTGTKTNGQEPLASIVIDPPSITEIGHRIQQYSPVKLGYLIDIDAGMLLGDCLDAVVLAAEDALDDGELKRPIEIIPMVARGLPAGGCRARPSPATRRCVTPDASRCMGPYITDNAMALLPAMERRQVATVSDERREALPQLLRIHARQRRRLRGGRDLRGVAAREGFPEGRRGHRDLARRRRVLEGVPRCGEAQRREARRRRARRPDRRRPRRRVAAPPRRGPARRDRVPRLRLSGRDVQSHPA